jgi:hypothetical protein
MPAFRTAELTALTADWRLLSSWVRSPVAPGTFLCSASTYRVKVMQFVSMGWPELDILPANKTERKLWLLRLMQFAVFFVVLVENN